MPAKRSRKRPAFVLYAVLYDPGGRSGNARLVIEGPFRTNHDAVITQQALLKSGRYSVASSHVSMISSAAFFHETFDKIRTQLT
jgi:hypothetical protein